MALPLEQSVAVQSVQNWRYHFDDFIVGPCNQLAYVASQSFCQDLRSADQLFLCSAPGLGKTHLAQAIGCELARQTNKSHVRVCYLSGEEFASQLVMAIKAKTVEQFKARFRGNATCCCLRTCIFSRVRKDAG
jgi:chromosomal replication initiator protein